MLPETEEEWAPVREERTRPEAKRRNRVLVEAELHQRLMSWRTLLGRNVAQSRQLLKKLIGRQPIVLQPENGVYRWTAQIVPDKIFQGILGTNVQASPTTKSAVGPEVGGLLVAA